MDLMEDAEKVSQEELHKRLRQLMFLDKDEKYFTSLLFTRTFEEVRKCKNCGFHGIMKKPARTYERNSYGSGLELYLSDRGVVGQHKIECPLCSEVEEAWSFERQDPPPDSHRIFGLEVRYYARKMMQSSLILDVMDLMKVEQMADPAKRKENYEKIGEFMLKNARRVSEEWCSPDNAEVRQSKLFWLYDQTIFSVDHKSVHPLIDDSRERYDSTVECFLHNLDKTESLLRLLKETLFDHPTRPVFMVWLCIAMTQVELFSTLVKFYDPKIFMDSDDKEFRNVRHQYKTLNMPREIKKIPIVLMLIEMPRFFHYTDFVHVRAGKKSYPSKESDVDRIMGGLLSKEGLKMAVGGTQGRKILKSVIQQSRISKKRMLNSRFLTCLDYLEHCEDFEKEFILKFHQLSMADQYKMCLRSIRIGENFSTVHCESELPNPIVLKDLFQDSFRSEVVVDDDLVPFKDQPKRHRDMKETLDMLTKKSQSIVLGDPMEEEMELRRMRMNYNPEVPKPKPESSSESSDEDDDTPSTLPLDEIMDRVRETLAERNISIPEKYMPRPITLPAGLMSSGSGNGGNLQALMLPVPPAGSKDAEDLAETMAKSRPMYSQESTEWANSIMKSRNVYTIHVPSSGTRNPDGSLQVTPQMFYHGKETLGTTLMNLGNHAQVARMAATATSQPSDETTSLPKCDAKSHKHEMKSHKKVKTPRSDTSTLKKGTTKNPEEHSLPTTLTKDTASNSEEPTLNKDTSNAPEEPTTTITDTSEAVEENRKQCATKRKGKIPRCCSHCNATPEKLLTCKACRSVAYCSSNCQRAHWKLHKKDCQKLQE